MAQTTPLVTIYVRHTAGCKHSNDEFARRCNCRKWLRWTQDGKRERVPANTRSWAEAEAVKREHEDRLSGRAILVDIKRNITACVESFLTEKGVQGITKAAVATYKRELYRLRDFCSARQVFTIDGVTRELMTEFIATWPEHYPSSVTRSKVRERYSSFLKFCNEEGWLPRRPRLPKLKVESVPTLPLTDEEFEHLLASIAVGLPDEQSARARRRVRSLFLLMRWSGLAIRDALHLRKTDITKNARGIYRVVTSRQKTGTHVSVPLPEKVAEEVLTTPNSNEIYIFWSGDSDPGNHCTKWQTRFVKPVFEAAGLCGGTMVSHRLRDTFAVDLLQKGVPIEEVSKLLGHSSIRVTERHYAAWVRTGDHRGERSSSHQPFRFPHRRPAVVELHHDADSGNVRCEHAAET